jgi:tripartite-type tricarboxylate transporter receptor subunit TctC
MYKKVTLIIIFLLILIVTFNVYAVEKYPSKPIKLVVPYGPGGLSDLTARIVAKHMVKYLEQPLVIVNTEGGGGVVGSQEVLKAPPDGYTLLWHHHSLLTAYVMGLADFNWDAFTPICGVASTGATIVVKATSPWKTLHDLLEDARKNPGKIRYGVNIGAMSHFGGLNLARVAGVKFTFVGGGGDAVRIAQLLRGEIDVCASGGLTDEYVKSGELRALAYAFWKRSPTLPDVPTCRELGIDHYEVFTFGVYGPKGLSLPIIIKLEQAFRKLSQDPEFQKEMLYNQRCEVNFMDRNRFKKYLEEQTKWLEGLAKEAGIKK